MSLLDDVSIVVTPNGYKAGELYAVVPVPTEGAEQVTNGDFASDLTGWTGYGTRSATGGVATIGASANSGIYQGVLTQGVRYTVTVNVTSYDGVGTAQFADNNGNNLYTITSTGIQTFTFISTIASSNLIIRGMSNALFSLSSVSVKEYTAADMDVTRATDATRVDEDGLIADVLSNVPRIDYTGGGCPHILAEPQRTNLIPYSEDLTQWNKGNLTISTDAIVSPDGTQNADTLNVIDDNDFIYESATTTASTEYVFTFYVKRGTIAESSLKLAVYDDTNNAFIVNISYSASDSEWTRVTQSFTTPVGCILIRAYAFRNSSTTLGTFSVWGGQVEAGSYATSYIPNFGTAAGVTRNQDIFTRDGIGSLINSTEGVLFVEMAALSDDSDSKRITISDGTLTNRITISIASNIISGFINVNNVTQYTFYESGITTTDFNKIAIKYKVNDFAIWINGVEYDVDTSGITFSADTLNTLNFSNATNLSNFFNGKVKQLQVYDTALDDTQLAALTS